MAMILAVASIACVYGLFFDLMCANFLERIQIVAMKKVMLLCCAAFFILAGCRKPEAPIYLGYDNFRIDKIGLAANVVTADLKLYNPNNYALQLKNADIDVYFNDRFLGHTSVNSLAELQPRDTSVVPLRLQASALDLVSHTVQVLRNPDVRVKMQGTARVGRGGVFINVPVNYEGVQRIELLGRDAAAARAVK
jgi:LEA14-like dessication related protein